MDYFSQIQNKWQCELKSCPNYGFTCLSWRGIHREIDSDDLNNWNDAILDGRATIYSPPLDLHLAPAESSRGKYKKDGYSSDSEMYHRSEYQNPAININIYDTPKKPTNTLATVSSDTSSPPITREASRLSDFSKPRPSPFDLMNEFRAWLTDSGNYSSVHKRLLEETFDEINEGVWTLEDLLEFKDDDWNVMDIQPSTGKKLVHAIHKFKKLRQGKK
jgi:hypothetical protein